MADGVTGRVMPAGGWAADRREPAARSLHLITNGARQVIYRWLDPPFRPEPPDCNQAYGICFGSKGAIVLVRTQEAGRPYWNLPGGGVEEGETLEAALSREVEEEACAKVLDVHYIGCQRVDETDLDGRRLRYYQARFWARVKLTEWEPRFETLERRLVAPDDFLGSLSWGDAPTAAWILQQGLRCEAGDRGVIDPALGPVLTDGVVTLRPMIAEDAESHLAGEDDEQVRWLSGGPGTLAGVSAWISRNQQSWISAGPVRNFGIVAAGELVGMVEANTDSHNVSGVNRGEANVAYGLYPRGRGRGYATRAVRLMGHYLADCGVTPVIRVHPQNPRSQQVALRCGFVPVGTTRTEQGDTLTVLRPRAASGSVLPCN